MWITPLLVATSAAVPCAVVHRDLVISNCHCQLGALQASHFCSPASKSVLMLLATGMTWYFTVSA